MLSRIQMIVVIVREQHHVERRQLADRRRDRDENAGARERNRRRAHSEDGIGENAHAVRFEQQRAVAEPRDAQAGRAAPCATRRSAISTGISIVGTRFLPPKKNSRMIAS